MVVSEYFLCENVTYAHNGPVRTERWYSYQMQIRLRYFILSLVAALVVGGVLTGGAVLTWVSATAASAPVPAPGAGQLDSDLAKVAQVYSLLQEQYYHGLDRAKLVEGAIDGMVKALGDPYTSYMQPEEADAFYENVSGSFEGIGAEIRSEEGYIIVVSPIHGSPAERAGLRPNDRLLEVNGITLTGMKVEEAVTHIRGPKGTEARLRIQRPGQEAPFELKLIRDTIPLESVITDMLPDQTAVIRITKVSETTADEFSRALNQVKAKGAKGIILDLRQNPGGLLTGAKAIAEYFVPAGRTLFKVKYTDGGMDVYQSAGHRTDLPVVALIDGGSASAAEILAGALRESAGVKLVGQTTFGKGTVQTTGDLEDGSILKVTIAEWLTPDGNQVHRKGITPDVVVTLPDYADLPYPLVDREYRQGEQAPVIQIIQRMLKALGRDPGRDDGLLDSPTASALQAFQSANQLMPTGTLTEATAQRMTLQLQQLIKENDQQLAKAREVLQEQINKR